MRVAFCCLFLVGFFCSQKCCADIPQTDTIKLQLKWRSQFQFAGYYAAQLKGYYAAQKLNVKILPGGPGINVINNVANGKADIGVFDPGILERQREVKKKSLVVLATIMQSSGYCIISLKEKNISVPADLIGKRVLVEKNQGWSIFKAILLKEGLDTNKVEKLSRLKDSEDILTGQADAVVTYITSQPQRLKAMGQKISIIRPEEYGVDFYGDFLFSTQDYAYRDINKTENFINASLKGWKYALAHQEEIIDYLLTLPDVKAYGVTREQLRYEAAEMKKLIMPNLVELGHTNIGRWQYMLKLLQELGVADKDFSLKGFVFDTGEYHKSRWYLPIIYSSIAILLIVITVVVINQQLLKRIKIRTAELSQEIEQRKLAEHLSNEKKEQIELILNSSNIGLWEFEIESKKPIFNQEFMKILGYGDQTDYSLDDFLKKIHPEDLKLANPLFETLGKSNIQKMIQLRVEQANGKYIYILASSKLLFKDGVPFKVSGVILSIQELKEKELEVLKVTEELIRRNNELKKFAYITSHNLRAPVVNISSLSDMMDQTSLRSENLEVFEKMKRSIGNLNSTLGDLIEVVAHDDSRNISLEKIDIEENIQSVIDVVKNQVMNFDTTVNLDLKIKELAFPKHLFVSIVLNLLTNAIKFSSADRKTVVNIETFNYQQNTILKFSDNGIGIDTSRNKSKIFGLYQRLDPQIEGKGVGLFIVRSHLDTFNGKIEVESELGKGTTFTLYFPNS